MARASALRQSQEWFVNAVARAAAELPFMVTFLLRQLPIR
jgi:hypothetical protein